MYKYTNLTLQEIQDLAPLFGCKFAVYMLLRLFAGSNGVAYPSQATLADLSGFNARNIRTALKQLQEAGKIEHIGYHQGAISTAKYRVGSNDPIGSNDPKGADQMILPSRIKRSYPLGSNDPTIIKKDKQKEEYKENEPPVIFPSQSSQSNQSTQSTQSPKPKFKLRDSLINWDTIKRI